MGQLHYKLVLVLQSETSIIIKYGNFASLPRKRGSITNWAQIIYYRMELSLLQSGKKLFRKMGYKMRQILLESREALYS